MEGIKRAQAHTTSINPSNNALWFLLRIFLMNLLLLIENFSVYTLKKVRENFL